MKIFEQGGSCLTNKGAWFLAAVSLAVVFGIIAIGYNHNFG